MITENHKIRKEAKNIGNIKMIAFLVVFNIQFSFFLQLILLICSANVIFSIYSIRFSKEFRLFHFFLLSFNHVKQCLYCDMVWFDLFTQWLNYFWAVCTFDKEKRTKEIGKFSMDFWTKCYLFRFFFIFARIDKKRRTI